MESSNARAVDELIPLAIDKRTQKLVEVEIINMDQFDLKNKKKQQ